MEDLVSDARRRLRQVLADQRFPAERWELIIDADTNGADGLSRAELRGLPAARFRSLDDVLYAVERGRRIDPRSGAYPPAA